MAIHISKLILHEVTFYREKISNPEVWQTTITSYNSFNFHSFFMVIFEFWEVVLEFHE